MTNGERNQVEDHVEPTQTRLGRLQERLAAVKKRQEEIEQELETANQPKRKKAYEDLLFALQELESAINEAISEVISHEAISIKLKEENKGTDYFSEKYLPMLDRVVTKLKHKHGFDVLPARYLQMSMSHLGKFRKLPNFSFSTIDQFVAQCEAELLAD